MKIVKGYSKPNGRPQFGVYNYKFPPRTKDALIHRHVEAHPPSSTTTDVMAAPEVHEAHGDIPPEFSGDPIILFSRVVNIPPGQVAALQDEAFRNPTGDWIEIREIRISAVSNTGGVAIATGAVLAVSISRGEDHITKDFVPLNLMGETEIFYSEIFDKSGALMYAYNKCIKLPTPIYLAPNQGLSIGVLNASTLNATTSITLSITLNGRACTATPSANRIPFFAGYQFPVQTFNAPLGPFYSTEADLQNNTSDYVTLTALTGVITVASNTTVVIQNITYPILATSDVYFLGTNTDAFMPENQIEIGITDRNGYPLVPVQTPWLMAFPKNGFAWAVNNAVLAPKEYLLLEMDVAAYANGTTLNNNRQFLCGVGMCGWRELSK